MSASVKVIAALLLIAAAGACADVHAEDSAAASVVLIDEPQPSDTLIGRVGQAPSNERRASTAPRVTSERARIIGSEPLVIGADGRPLTELGGVSYRWWRTHGRADVGVGVGALGRVVAPPPGVVDGGTYLTGSVPTVTLGWRYRVDHDSVVFADASGARGLGLNGTGNYVNTKLGAEWKSPASRFGLDKRGHLGVQFDSGYRMSLRLRKSGVGVYVRGQF